METRCLTLRDTPDGWGVLEIRGERHLPDYDVDEISEGMDEQKRRREVLGDWSATAGKLVYPQFGAMHIASQSLPYDPQLPLILGWDVGGSPWSGTPACCISQISYYGQWLIYPPVVVDERETVDILEFAREWVARELAEAYAEPNGIELDDLKILHFGDPAGNNPPPKHLAEKNRAAETRTCYETIQLGERLYGEVDEFGDREIVEKPGLGWLIQNGEGRLTKRLQIVRTRLDTNLRGHPSLLVDPEARAIIDGFQGGYHYHQRSDGSFELDPKKNHDSHILNALEYACSGLTWAIAQTREEEYGGYLPHTGAATWGHRRRE